MSVSKSILFLIAIVCLSCTQSRVKKYEEILEPLVGNAKKDAVNEFLGNPHSCHPESPHERCEYRTGRAQNHPIPAVFRKLEGFGPDVSPYQYFDVLYLYFDDFGVLSDWQPVISYQVP